MALLFFSIFAACILVLGSVFPSECALFMEPQEITVVVDQETKFTLKSNSELLENVTVKLSASYADIVRIEPCEFVIPAKVKTFSQDIKALGLTPGHVEIVANISLSTVDVSAAFVKVTSEHSPEIAIVSITVGWIYFFVWSISFYPQMYENWKRKSVVGLNFDFLALNLIGFSLYALFNCGLYWIPLIKDQYFARYPHGAIPVLPNDIFFAVHAVIVTLITIVQCCIYERGGQTVSIVARWILGAFFLFLLISMLCSVFKVLLWLDFLYYCSYVKLTITLIKYIPQAYMNYRRKSTVGWSIGNIFCDFTGGVLSVLQMVLDAYNYDDWASIFGSPTKFGLGFFSVLFDIFFMVQHYILYRNQDNLHSGYERLDGEDTPQVSTNYAPQESEEEDKHSHNELMVGATSASVT